MGESNIYDRKFKAAIEKKLNIRAIIDNKYLFTVFCLSGIFVLIFLFVFLTKLTGLGSIEDEVDLIFSPMVWNIIFSLMAAFVVTGIANSILYIFFRAKEGNLNNGLIFLLFFFSYITVLAGIVMLIPYYIYCLRKSIKGRTKFKRIKPESNDIKSIFRDFKKNKEKYNIEYSFDYKNNFYKIGCVNLDNAIESHLRGMNFYFEDQRFRTAKALYLTCTIGTEQLAQLDPNELRIFMSRRYKVERKKAIY